MVDDLVRANLDLLSIGEIAGLAVGPHAVADDRGVGGRRQLDVVLGDPADTSMHEADLDLVTLQLAERLGEGFERTVDVGLDDQVERGRLARWIWSKMSSSLAPPARACASRPSED